MKEEDFDDKDVKNNEEYEFEDESDAEDMEDYKWDGYHPVYLGETFHNGKYTVVQKLGWGNFSTVWLMKDKKPECDNKKVTQYAMKIQKSKPSYAEVALDELELLRALQNGKSNEDWSLTYQQLNKIGNIDLTLEDNYCIDLLDNFAHYGIHGKHYCTIFPIMGPNLLDVMRYFVDEREHGIPLK